jgi:hypothetical protein
MAYDIYGEVLGKGCCEVHPWVNQSYPCSTCYDESRQDAQKNDYDKQMEREYRDAETAHYRHEYCMENSKAYRTLYRLRVRIDKILVHIIGKCPF